MEEEVNDDFGELYADIQLPLPLFESSQTPTDNARNNPNSISCPPEIVSCSSTSDEEYAEHAAIVPDEVGCNDVIVCEENGSDSEDDDLLIVLNDEDCPVGAPRLPPRYARSGNANGVASSDEDGGDNLVIVAGDDLLSKDRKRAEPSSDGVEQLPHFSLFKYIRPHAKASVSYSITGGRGDWDSNGGEPPTFSSNRAVVSPHSFRSPFVSRNGSEFYLPRNRTIFDVAIDKFEQKPWRNSGVDKTDFFNFGLDEESWKMYCMDLECFRQQTDMHTSIHVSRSLGTKRVSGSGSVHEFQSSKAAPTETGLFKKGENSFPAPENCETGERHFEMPKGRAIQVEDSMTERMSSMDMKRIRYRDSDVVIQISVQDAAEKSSVFAQDEPDLMLDPLAIKQEKKKSDISDEQIMQESGSSSADGSRSSLTRNSQAKALFFPLSQNEERSFRENSWEPALDKVSDGEENGLGISYESSTVNHAQSVSGHFDTESHHSDDSRIEAAMELVDSACDYSKSNSGTSESQNCCSRDKCHASADLRRHKYDNGCSPGNFMNDWDNGKHARVRRGARTCKEKQRVCAYYEGEELSSYHKKMAPYDDWKRDGRQITRSAYSKLYARANLDRRYDDVHHDLTYYNLEKRLPKNELREREFYLDQSRHTEERIYERANLFSNSYNENERHIHQNHGSDNNQKVRYRVEERNKHERLGLYHHRRESALDEYGRCVPLKDSKLEKWAIEQFEQSCHSGFTKTGKQFYHAGPLLDHAYRDFHISNREDCDLSSPQRNDECYSWRLRGRHTNEWKTHHSHCMGLKDSDNGERFFPSGNVHNYTFHRLRRPDIERDVWNDISIRDRRNNNIMYHKYYYDQDISYQLRESFSYKRRLGHIGEHDGKILDRQHLVRHREKWVGEQYTDMGINDRDDTLNGRESVHLHLNNCRTKYQHGRLGEDRDPRGHRHSHLSNGHSPISGRYNEIHTGKGPVSEDKQHPFPDFSAEDNDGQGCKNRWTVECPKISGSEAVQSTVFQSDRVCHALPKGNFEKAKLSLADKLKCSDKFEDKTADGISGRAKAIKEYEQRRILETLEKMERRKERFKASIVSEKEPSASLKHQKDEALVEADEVKLERPARKRRWGEE